MSGRPDFKPGVLPNHRHMYVRCEDCGGWKARHAFRCRKCSPKIRGSEHYAWKGDSASETTKRERARARYALGLCERCEKKATERHHIDGDTGNNEAENIQILCRRCHMEVDGRLERLRRYKHKSKPTRPCEGCGRKKKPLRWGYCGACYERARKAALKAQPHCRVCGASASLTAHHLVPRSLGGQHVIENLAVLCVPCHQQVEERSRLHCNQLRESLTLDELAYILVEKGERFLSIYYPRRHAETLPATESAELSA